MGSLYNVGENKVRPGVYRRYENVGSGSVAGAEYGLFAIPVHADFGPLATVTGFSNDEISDLKALYGTGGTVDAALALFDGGATKVYVYRLGTGGTNATLSVKAGESSTIATLSTKYPTTSNYNITIKPKLTDASVKQILVYLETMLLETIEYATSEDEKAALVEAVNSKSKFISATAGTATGAAEAIANSPMTGGAEPTVNTESYSEAFTAFEAYKWNMLVLDTCETDVHALAQSYINRIFNDGALGVCVLGEPTTVEFDTRKAHARAFNDEKIIYLGSGYENSDGKSIDGYLSVAVQAGIIGSLPSNESATHTVVPGAVNTLEVLKNSQYEDAINNGMLLLSPNDEGQVWFDSGINTLITLDSNQDEGWKKIRRTSTRFEMFDRIDRTVAPLIGRVNCDDVGINDVIAAGQKVLDAMASGDEKKIAAGATFAEDTEYKRGPDYAYFVISAQDLDSLEKIYLRYQFRFSAE